MRLYDRLYESDPPPSPEFPIAILVRLSRLPGLLHDLGRGGCGKFYLGGDVSS